MSETFDKDTGLYLNNVKVYQDDYGLYLRTWNASGAQEKFYVLNVNFTLHTVISNLKVLNIYYQNSLKTPIDRHLTGSAAVTYTDLQKAFSEYKAAEAKKKEF